MLNSRKDIKVYLDGSDRKELIVTLRVMPCYPKETDRYVNVLFTDHLYKLPSNLVANYVLIFWGIF